MNDNLIIADSEEFKKRVLGFSGFSEEERNEIASSDLSFRNIKFGLTPNGMGESLFVKVMRLDKSWFDVSRSLPLLPSVQRSWSGSRLADWLISAGIVDPSKWKIISKNLNGKLFLAGRVLDILSVEEVDDVISGLTRKVENISIDVWNLTQSSNDARTVISSFFNMHFGVFSSKKEIQVTFRRKFILKLPTLRPIQAMSNYRYDPNYGAMLAFEQPYLAKESIAKSFVGHIVNLTSLAKPEEYFASYIFLGQSSCMGKSRLLSESLMYGDHALFIFQINCRPLDDRTGFPYSDLETDKLVRHILQLKTQEEMTCLLLALLHVVFSKAVSNDFLVDTKKLSFSMKDLGITFNQVLYHSISNNQSVIGLEGLERIQGIISELKLKRHDLKTLKVIPVIAFDEAAILIKNKFYIRCDDDDPSRTYEEINTFRLIRRFLNKNKGDLWGCPFVFAGTNTSFLNFVPPLLEGSSARNGYGPDDAVTGGRKLFVPYVLARTFNVFAREKNRANRDIGDWKAFINSFDYPEELCNYGRPFWGAMLQAGQLDGNSISKSLDDVFLQALYRIHYEAPNPWRERSLSRTFSAMAIVGILAGIDWSTEKCAADLVERRMAFLAGHDSDIDRLHITYPPEPVLAMAALTRLLRYPAQVLEDVEAAEYGALSRCIGVARFFVVKILFLLSLSEPNIERPHFSARDMFQNLLGKENMEMLEKNDVARILLCGSVCFSYFATFTGLSDSPFTNIASMIRLNAALFMPNIFPGVHVLIPVVLENGQLGSINIQVRNYTNPLTDFEIYRNKIYPDLVSPDIPKLNMIINVGPKVKDRFFIREDEQGTTIIMEGKKTCFGATIKRNPLLEEPFHTLLSDEYNEDVFEFLPFESNVNNVDDSFPDS